MTYTTETEINLTSQQQEIAEGVYVVVHGHFYQPPRENPYLDAIERQPSASPFHDWNERIHHECYRPNAFARIFNDYGQVVKIVNNYEYLSFNIGPTLMNWLEGYDVEVYQKILEADRISCERLNGHGNAIAQVYNHIILPLANQKDKYTQIRWGKYDFQSRFKREPEGMWLAETAIDYDTLEALINEGIKFIILAPSQAQKCRAIPTPENLHPEWINVGEGQIDATRPYRCYLTPKNYQLSDRISQENLPYIDIFFYDGPISRDIGFNDVLDSSHNFSGRISQAIRHDDRPAQLIAVATDGETFGHHKHGKERCIAHAFTNKFSSLGWQATNFAHYLSINPPIHQVELKPVTAWSCFHGVGRWQDDCGCAGGGNWHQKWRRPLRDALNWLRDQLIPIYEKEGSKLFLEPWGARDEYIKIMRDRTADNIAIFFMRYQLKPLNPTEQVDALRLLEMQKQTLLMFTSCGWFFEEISRPEGVQILRYAARALELAGDLSGLQLEKEFLQRLELAPSNEEKYQNGAGVYGQLVVSAQVSFKQVAAHYAISSLFSNYPQQHRLYCYETHQLDYQLQKMGGLTLAIGQLKLVSEITWESEHLVFVVLHLGGWDFHCVIQPFIGRLSYSYMVEKLTDILQEGSAANVILKMVELCSDKGFNLQNLFPEERHRIMRLLSQETLSGLDKLYTQVYKENYGVLMAFKQDEMPVPKELQVAAEIAINYRLLNCLKSLEQDIGEAEQGINDVIELEGIAKEARLLKCTLNLGEGKAITEQLIERSLWHLLHDTNPVTLETDMQKIERILDVAKNLNMRLDLAHSQEIYFNYFANISSEYKQQLIKVEDEENQTLIQLRKLLRLGEKLAVDVNNNYSHSR